MTGPVRRLAARVGARLFRCLTAGWGNIGTGVASDAALLAGKACVTRMRALDPLAEDDVVRLAEPVRRLLAGSEGESQDVDDLTQETLLRVWEVRGRVDRAAAEPYALAVARNLLVGRRRQRQVHGRHAHRMFDPGEPVHPEDVALRREQREAAAATFPDWTRPIASCWRRSTGRTAGARHAPPA